MNDSEIQTQAFVHVVVGNPKKAAFILQTDETIGTLRASESHSLFVNMIQRVASFQKSTVNIVFESSSSTSTDANCCDSSTCTKNTALGKSPKESKKTTTRKSRSKLPQTHGKLEDFLEKTNDVRLADDGKSMKCLLCGKNPKLDISKRSNSGHLKYFRRVHRCSVRAEVEGPKTRKIDEFYGPVEKRPRTPRVGTQPDADIVVNVEERTDLEDLESGTNMPDTPKEVTDTVNSV